MGRRWPPPVYELNHEEGLPHERMFTIHCVIEDKFTETGAGKSKKLAKRQAANKMIQRLRDLPMENEDAFQNIDDDELAQVKCQVTRMLFYFYHLQGLVHRLSQTRDTGKSMSHSQQVSKNMHKNLKSSQGDLLTRLKDLTLTELEDCVSLLQDIGKEQQFEVTFVEVEEESKRGLSQCMVQMSTLPVSVCYGQGQDPGAARQSAARDGLDYLKLMTT